MEDSCVRDKKPLLGVDDQIANLKARGVTFELCSEEAAAQYLSQRTYLFKLAAYRGLFERRIGGLRNGQYVGLDFGHLVTLASLDRDLRYALLPLTLDVEHAARTKIMGLVTKRGDEDGYAIVADYYFGLNHAERRRREGEIGRLSADIFSGDLVRKYSAIAEMPVWVLMELISFGSFIDFYLFCANRWDDKAMHHEHYRLRQAKSIRNACAHSSAIVNGFASNNGSITADNDVKRAVSQIICSRRVRALKLRNPRILQITTLLYLHGELIRSGTGRRRAIAAMAGLRRRFAAVIEELEGNDTVRSSLGFLDKLIDAWF